MAKIVFSFAGTGDEGINSSEHSEAFYSFGDDVIRIYLQGCHHHAIGDSSYFPDLEIVSNNIHHAFQKDKTIDLIKLHRVFGKGISRMDNLPLETTNPQITDIALHGFSRGAVTCFAVAKKLDRLGIPIDIVANQPVPGQIVKNSPSSLYKQYHDLTQCSNIRSATTLIGSYNLDNGLIENQFYQQMLARFSPQTRANTWLIPHQTHSEWLKYWLTPYHLRRLLFEAGYLKPTLYQDYYEDEVKFLYESYPNLCFTPKEFMQPVFGAEEFEISKDPTYLKIMQDKAQNYLDNPQVNLTDAQASAIVAISKLYTLDANKKEAMLKFVQEDHRKARKFIQIINLSQGIIDYLAHITEDKRSSKSMKIQRHSSNYKQTVFTHSYDYLTKENPTTIDQDEFVTVIKQAEKNFAEQALNIDRNLKRRAMKIITNTILHATLLGTVINMINKAITGDWFLFNKTRSANVVRETTKEIAKLCDSEIKKAEELLEQQEDEQNKLLLQALM